MKVTRSYAFVLLILLLSCSKSYLRQNEAFSHIPTKGSGEDPKAKELIGTYKTKVDAETERVIAFASDPLTKEKKQHTLGNFVCDALMFSAKKAFNKDSIHICIVNRGGLRADLPRGNIKAINIFEVMPFDNELVLISVSGDKLLEGINTLLEKHHSYLGLSLKLRKGQLEDAFVNGQPIEKTRIYTIATSDFLANGGDAFNFLKDPVNSKVSGITIRDAIIGYSEELSKNGKQIIPYTDGRLEISE